MVNLIYNYFNKIGIINAIIYKPKKQDHTLTMEPKLISTKGVIPSYCILGGVEFIYSSGT